MRGSLTDDALPTLLHQVFSQKATGTLSIQNRAGVHEIHLRDGYPVSVQLPGSTELIGKVMVEMGMLDETTYKRTLTTQLPAGRRYGDMLLAEGLVTDDQMRLALKAQVRRKLHRLFFLDDGQYQLHSGEHQHGLHKGESMRILPQRAIYHGVRSAWSDDRLAGALFLVEGRAVKCKLDADAVARYGVGPDDGRLAELVRGGFHTMPELIATSGLPAQVVHALLYAFYITDALELKNAAAVVAQQPAAPAPPRLVPLPPNAQAASSGPPRELSGAWKMPSGAFTLPQPDPPKLHVSMQPSTPTITTPETPAGDGDLRVEIERKAKAVESQNLFEVLELQQTANKEQVKAAYLLAAKRYHPDRLASIGLEELRVDVDKIFRRVSEAYNTLGDDTRRAQYLEALNKPKEDENEAHAKAMQILQAEMSFRRGEILYKKNDFTGAIREFEASVAANPQEGEHLTYLAWARLCAGQISHADAKNLLLQSQRISPQCARTCYFLGLCFKQEKDIDRAYAQFKRACELDARLLEAESEIRLINMRREKEKSVGFFDRFRKK
jgi:curved DNA-binding protein CbpA